MVGPNTFGAVTPQMAETSLQEFILFLLLKRDQSMHVNNSVSHIQKAETSDWDC